MPCLSYDATPHSYQPDNHQSRITQLTQDKARLEAGLCAVMTYIEHMGIVGDFVSSTDWEEAGITSAQLRSWWEDHKEKDKRRRAIEAKIKSEKEKHEKMIAHLQSKTWSELTADEIKVLLNNTEK